MLRCPGCGLDNPELARRCARCGSLLHIPANVIPPRAGRGGFPKRLFYAFRRRRGFRWRQPEARPVSAGFRNAEDRLEVVPPREILQALVPSLFQFRHRRRIRGWIYLACFMLGLLGVWSLPGTPYFYWAIWLVVLSQVWSIADAIPWRGGLFERLLQANLFGVALFIVLAMLHVRLSDRVFDALGLIRVDPRYAEGPLRHGMYCRIVPRQTYRPGDIVAYRSRMPFRRFGSPPVDRILAAGPAELAIRDGVLLVDGNPCRVRPLLPIELIGDFKRRMRRGEYCIIAGGFRLRFADQEYFARTVILPEKDILGRIEIRFPRWKRTGGLL